MGPLTHGERRIAERSATPWHPAGKPATSLCGVITRLRSQGYRGAPECLVNEGLKRVNYPGSMAIINHLRQRMVDGRAPIVHAEQRVVDAQKCCFNSEPQL
jgi:predicted trehalose synthase